MFIPLTPLTTVRDSRRLAARLGITLLAAAAAIGGGSAAHAQTLIVSSTDGADNTGAILQFNPTTGAPVGDGTLVAPGSGGLDLPAGITFGPDGNLYVGSYDTVDQDGDTVKRYDGATGAFLGTFVTNPGGSGPGDGQLHAPLSLLFDPKTAGGDSLLVLSQADDSVKRYDGTTGAYLGDFVTADSGGAISPDAMTLGADGDLYVAATDTNTGVSLIQRYSGTTGAYLGDFVTEAGGGLLDATGLTFGPDGSLYVSDAGQNEILRFDGTTGALIGSFVGGADSSSGLSVPYNPLFGPGGNLYVASYGDNTVKLYNGATGAYIEDIVSAGSAGLVQPFAIAFEPAATGGAAAAPEPGTFALAFLGAIGGLILPRRSRISHPRPLSRRSLSHPRPLSRKRKRGVW